MQELSLNILDITHNSIKAEANKIEIILLESQKRNLIEIEIRDDGRGMDKDFLASVVNPFVTTRTTRKVGLGIPLFKQSAEIANGTFQFNPSRGRVQVFMLRIKWIILIAFPSEISAVRLLA